LCFVLLLQLDFDICHNQAVIRIYVCTLKGAALLH